MVLCCRTDHARSADIDVFDAGVEIRTFGNGFFERIKVHTHQIDRRNVVIFHRLHVAGKRTAAQKAAVNLRMKSLDATVHDFGKTGVIGNFLYRNTSSFDGLGRTTGRQDFNTLFMKGFGKFDQTGLVGNGDQRARNTSSHRVRFQYIVNDEGPGPIDDISAYSVSLLVHTG